MSGARVIEIFVASPGDLQGERDAVTEVARQATQLLAPQLNVHFTVNGWEDHPSGFGRPQEQINELLDRSEVFVGLLQRKWGSPTGTHSSGFHEEFERARDQRRASGTTPELGLFFKEVPDHERDDPGEELTKVLEFRQQVVDAREVLFKTFDTTDAFRALLLAFLIKYALETSGLAATEVATRAPDAAAETPAIEPPSSEVHNQGDALATVERVSERLRHAERIDPVDAARLNLTAVAALARRTEATLGVHEANILYAARRDISPSNAELFSLVDAAAESLGTAPAWFWVERARGESDELFAVRVLIVTAIQGATHMSRRRAYEMLTRIGERLPQALLSAVKTFDPAIPELTAPTDVVGRGEQALLLSTIADDDDIWPLLEPMLEQIDGEVDGRLVRNLFRTRPTVALSLLSRVKRSSPALADAAIEAHEALELASVRAVMASGNTFARGIGLRLLDEKGALTEPEARGFLSDPEYQVSNAATDVMLHHGWSIGEEEWRRITETSRKEILRSEPRPTRSVRYHQQLPVSDLEQLINWYMPWTADAYEALGLVGAPGFADRVRRDLQDRFTTFAAASRVRTESMFGEHAGQFFQHEEWNQQAFIPAALAILGQEDQTDADIDTAASFLNDQQPEIVVSAVRALGRLGAADRLDEIVTAADRAISDRKWDDRLVGEYVDTVFALAQDPGRGAQLLIESSVDDVVVSALDRLTGQPGLETRARDLLLSEASGRREAAARYLASVLEPDALESELDEYVAQGRYFYSVVGIWDAALYGANGIRAAYRLPPVAPESTD